MYNADQGQLGRGPVGVKKLAQDSLFSLDAIEWSNLTVESPWYLYYHILMFWNNQKLHLKKYQNITKTLSLMAW